MKRFYLLLGVLLLCGCGRWVVNGQFYVRSENDGYHVCAETVINTTCLDRKFRTPNEAQKIVEKLNEDKDK